jgi:hypothetical protein
MTAASDSNERMQPTLPQWQGKFSGMKLAIRDNHVEFGVWEERKC